MSASWLLTTFPRLATLLLVFMPVSASAQSIFGQVIDCTLNVADPVDVQVKCAIRHANFLYAGVCNKVSYCSSQDQQMLAAYAAAFRIFGNSHAVLEKSADAYWSGFLQERAHLFPGATSSYLTCMTLALKERTVEPRRSCATRLAVVSCALDNNSSYCKEGNTHRLSVSSGGGTVASIPEEDERKAVNGVLVPDSKNVAILQQVLTDPEKKTMRALLQDEKLTIVAKQFVAPAVAP